MTHIPYLTKQIRLAHIVEHLFWTFRCVLVEIGEDTFQRVIVEAGDREPIIINLN